MAPDTPDRQSDDDAIPPVECVACRSAFEAVGRQTVSFLLLDQLTVPLVGCDDHLERFTTVCGFTTETDADLLAHPPAGGITCAGCRLAPYNPNKLVIPVETGAVGVLACPDHQSEIVDRFQTGHETRAQLTSSLDPSTT